MNSCEKINDISINLCLDKDSCCGCSACYAACPVSAITMTADEEGFLYPVINDEKCIKCKKCLSVCMFKQDQKKKGF